MSKTKYKDYDKANAPEEFDKYHFGNNVGKYFLKSQEKIIFEMITSDAKSKTSKIRLNILDVGAGTGRLSIPLAKKGASVTSFDASKNMLSYLKQKAKKQKVTKIRCIKGNATKLPFKKQAFDYSISSRLLLHLENDWKKVISEMCRVSNAIIIDVPPKFGFAELGMKLLRFANIFGSKKQAYKTFTIKEIDAELKKCGFEITEIKRQFVLPFKIHRKLDILWLTKNSEAICKALGLTYLMGAPIIIKAKRK